MKFITSFMNQQSSQNATALRSPPSLHLFCFCPFSSWRFLSTAPRSHVLRAGRNNRSGKMLFSVQESETQSSDLCCYGDPDLFDGGEWGAEAGDNIPSFLYAPLVSAAQLQKMPVPAVAAAIALQSRYNTQQAVLQQRVKTECQAIYVLLLC